MSLVSIQNTPQPVLHTVNHSLFPPNFATAMELSSSLPLIQPACSCSKRHVSRSSLQLALAAPPSAALADFSHSPSSYSSSSASSSSSSSSPAGIPKMEPFNRSRVSRLIREPSLLDKAEHAISDRCSVLEGDDAYRCWETLFEFEDMKEELTGQCNIAPASERPTACRPLERLENFVRQSGGVTSLINNVRMLVKANELRKSADKETSKRENTLATTESSHKKDNIIQDAQLCFEPGSFPPSEEELELERSSKMPESPFTRVLRTMGVPSPWLS